MNETRVFLEKVRPQSMGRELEVQLGGEGCSARSPPNDFIY